MKSVELFGGAGGLAMGISLAGFEHSLFIENNGPCCDTLSFNKERGVRPVKDWPVLHMDVKRFDFSVFENKVDLVAGGPPCQPFSLGGKHRGNRDGRDLFPEAIRVVREIRPKAFIFENVKGLLRQSFAKYFEYILLQLTYPEIYREANEEWNAHLGRLENYHTGGRRDGLYYRVVFRLMNSADYGVPQKRERVIIVGIRSDLNIEWSFPKPTHSRNALLWSKWETGQYWEKHLIARRKIPESPPPDFAQAHLLPPEEKPWVTVRDSISDLPEPRAKNQNGILNHVFQAGAKPYPGHTGSPLDEPAKTLKAGDHGVPGGENMMVTPDGEVRYFTVRESARLQTFPDDFAFRVSWTESMRQLGNAVPVRLGQVVASKLISSLF